MSGLGDGAGYLMRGRLVQPRLRRTARIRPVRHVCVSPEIPFDAASASACRPVVIDFKAPEMGWIVLLDFAGLGTSLGGHMKWLSRCKWG
jgi:hypothetical protein